MSMRNDKFKVLKNILIATSALSVAAPLAGILVPTEVHASASVSNNSAKAQFKAAVEKATALPALNDAVLTQAIASLPQDQQGVFKNINTLQNLASLTRGKDKDQILAQITALQALLPELNKAILAQQQANIEAAAKALEEKASDVSDGSIGSAADFPVNPPNNDLSPTATPPESFPPTPFFTPSSSLLGAGSSAASLSPLHSDSGRDSPESTGTPSAASEPPQPSTQVFSQEAEKIQRISEINIGAKKDLLGIKLKLLNDITRLIQKHKGLDIKHAEFDTMTSALLDSQAHAGSSSAVISLYETTKAANEKILKAEQQGIDKNNFVDLKQHMEAFESDLRNDLSSEGGVQRLLTEFYKLKSSEQVNFLDSSNRFMNQTEKMALVDRLIPDVKFPVANVLAFAKNPTTITGDLGPIIQRNANKFFGQKTNRLIYSNRWH